MKAAAGPESAGYPEPCQHCGMCQWRPECERRWSDDDHLSLVANITKSHTKKLNAGGISTVVGLAAYWASEFQFAVRP